MTLVTIGPNSDTDVLITLPTLTSKSYAEHFSSFIPRCFAPEFDTTVFADEPQGSVDVGASRCVVPFGGVAKQGIGTITGTPIAPLGRLLANPRNCATTWQIDAGCTIIGNFHYNDVTVPRVANVVSTFAGIATNAGTYVIAWDES